MIITDNSDMSLSTLITNVERDIELLEQLQNDNEEDDIKKKISEYKNGEFLGSSKLLSLPGYKPKTSPPPPVPSRHRQRHQSDSFLNTSSERAEDEGDDDDYVPLTPPSPEESSCVHGFLTDNLGNLSPMYCPYCAGNFYHQHDLQEHLLHAHEDELNYLQNQETKLFTSQTCPCCGAQFLKVNFSP